MSQGASAVSSRALDAGPASGEPAPFAPRDLGGLYAQVDDFLRRHLDARRRRAVTESHLHGDFSLEPSSRKDLSGSCDVAYFLFALGELEQRTSPASRQRWVREIAGPHNGYQNPETGLFEYHHPASPTHAHATGFAVGALRLLGGQAHYPIFDAQRKLASPDSVNLWVRRFLWIYIWGGAHAMGTAAAAHMAATPLPAEAWHWVFDELDRHLSPHTGLFHGWRPQARRRPDTIALGGAAHFWWQYQEHGRAMPFARQALHSILALQQPSGRWGRWWLRCDFPYYIDYDAVAGLAFGYDSLPPDEQAQLREPILRSLERFADSSARMLNDDMLLRYFSPDAHRVTGGILGMAEAQQFYYRLTNRPLLITPTPMQSPRGRVCWL
jgi:hypothetical protein